MIATLMLSLQIAAASSPGRSAPLLVQGVSGETRIATEQPDGAQAIRADLLAAALGGTIRSLPNGHVLVAISGAEVDFTPLVPFARSGATLVPLVSAPRLADGHLLLPMHFVSEVLPRLAIGVIYDPARGEIRTFAAMARTRTPAPAPASRLPRATRRDELPPPRGGGGARHRLVVVDAGHGGVDNGMSGPIGGARTLYEKDITLAVARLVDVELRSRAFDVVLTRDSDTLIALGDRGRIANQRHGDLFLSIHVNAANLGWHDPGAARGFETYFLAEAKTEEARRVEQMENEAVRFETGANAPKGDPLSFIINDMAQNEHLRESSDLAETVQEEIGRVHPGPSRGVKQANFAVLRTSFMPAVLIEIGFGTNVEEAAFLESRANQRRIASAIADATERYLASYQRRVGTTP